MGGGGRVGSRRGSGRRGSIPPQPLSDVSETASAMRSNMFITAVDDTPTWPSR